MYPDKILVSPGEKILTTGAADASAGSRFLRTRWHTNFGINGVMEVTDIWLVWANSRWVPLR